MGYLVAFARKMYLVSYINNIEVRLKDITEEKLGLTDTIAEFSSQISDIGDPDHPAVKKLKARQVELENLDKKLDIKMQKLQTQLQAANTELQSADQALQSSIQKSFTYRYGG